MRWRRRLKKFETTKLFYNKYLYKLTLRNSLSPIFRDKNLSFARQVLDKLQHKYEHGERLIFELGIREKPITEDNFLDSKKLYKIFSKCDDYKLRVQGNSISIYSNDKNWLTTISDTVCATSLELFYEPDTKFIEELNSNSILITQDIGYQFKVTLGQRKGSSEFGKWAENNPTLVKVGPILKEELANLGFVNGMYFYARDERILQLCQLMLSNIRRIDKLVVKSNLDK